MHTGSKDTVASTNIEIIGQIPPEKLDNTELLKSIQTMFDNKINQIESKFESLIDSKLGKRLEGINTFNENNNEQNDVSNVATSKNITYSNVLQGPKDFRIILQETRNEEKVEEMEKERRSKIFIIHGFDEKGDDNAAIKDNDKKLIARFLEVIGSESQPESFTRLGKPNGDKRRTIKVVMKTKDEKVNVMANLKRLKDTVDEFGRISITDDYTSGEREQIKSWVKKAEEKSAQDPKYVYKVRGVPKNGMRLVSFTRQNPNNI